MIMYVVQFQYFSLAFTGFSTLAAPASICEPSISCASFPSFRGVLSNLSSAAESGNRRILADIKVLSWTSLLFLFSAKSFIFPFNLISFIAIHFFVLYKSKLPCLCFTFLVRSILNFFFLLLGLGQITNDPFHRAPPSPSPWTLRMLPGALSKSGDTWPALPDHRNETILVWVGAGLTPRCFASMSVFDSTVQVKNKGKMICLICKGLKSNICHNKGDAHLCKQTRGQRGGESKVHIFLGQI